MRAALAAIVLLLVLAPAALGDDIPVVRTYGDLLDLQPIDLGEGITVRLGIEATSAPPGGAVTVYCLTEGYTLPEHGPWPPERLGPLRVVIERDGVEQPVEAREFARFRGEEHPAGRPRLFRRLVTLGEAKRCEVRLGAGIATVTATADAPSVPFFAFVYGKKSHLALGPRAPALPVRSSDVSIPVREFTDRRDPLPAIVPEAPSKGMVLDADVRGDVLHLEVQAPRPIVVSHETYHWFARWWVNGQPVLGDPEAKRLYMQGTGQVVEEKTASLAIAFDPAAIGAAPGDKIEVQLLYDGRGEGEPLLTPRASFIAATRG